MSNHNSQKAINLHHDQVNAGRARREYRQAERLFNFLSCRAEARLGHQIAMALSAFGICYMMIALAVYSGNLLS